MKLVFTSTEGLVFDVRRTVAAAVSSNKRLRKLGLTSVCWLGALRMSVHFSRELTPREVAAVTKAVRAARAAAFAPVAPVAPTVKTVARDSLDADELSWHARQGLAQVDAEGRTWLVNADTRERFLVV